MPNSTKDRITLAALDLFSLKGYDGVGIDSIGAKVGLKGPSIYRHFKSKEDILNNLIEIGEFYYEKNFGSVSGVEIPKSMDELKQLTINQLNFTINDEIIKKFRRLFIIEQFKKKRIASLTTLHHLTGIEKLYTHIFTGMIKNGVIKEYDPYQLAIEYTSPITMMIHFCDREPELVHSALSRIEKHIDFFISIYKK